MTPPFFKISLRRRLLWGLAALLLALSPCWNTEPQSLEAFREALVPATSDKEQPPAPPTRLPGLSGLAWVGADTLLAVHDAKASPEERDHPRLSLLRGPTKTNRTLNWRPLAVNWPASHGPSSDLESIARVPGTHQFILALPLIAAPSRILVPPSPRLQASPNAF